MKPSVLVVDDDPGILEGFSKYLTRVGFVVRRATCLREAREALSQHRFDAVLLDLRLPDGNGIDWIAALRESYPDMALVVITGFGDIPLAVEAMRRGADHFLTKPVDMRDLELFLRKCIEVGTLRRRSSVQRRLAKEEKPFWGHSPVMQEVMRLAALAAETDSPILIQGETGTGKGVLARWIHDHSPRASMPFVEVNCSSLRGELLASELFGHVKGAFTTAIRDHPGLIEVADGGTLFLDEIGDMDLGVQAQLLKVLEEKQYRRLGDTRVRRSDFRLICATNQDLLQAMRVGRFRKDLYFRIHTLTIVVPPLRERLEDLPALVRHLLVTLGAPDRKITSEALQLLRTYPWPGNIRELKNLLERALLLSRGGPLTPTHFPGLGARDALLISPEPSSFASEEERILEAIRRFRGNKKKAAQALGISRATLYRRLRKMQGVSSV